MEFTKVDEILSWLRKAIDEKRILSAHEWVRAAQTLNILRSEPQEHLCAIESDIAKIKEKARSEGKTAADAKIIAEASDEFLMANIIKRKLERITEAIRLAKSQAKLSDEEYKGY